jgi:ribosomal protein L7Ae-like RNA K-turn-binding protein
VTKVEGRLPEVVLRPEVLKKLMGLVGLGLRGRLAVTGVQKVREAALRGRLRLAIVAPDASRHSLAKVVPLLDARRVRRVSGPGVAQLGAAAVGIVDHQLAKGIEALVESKGGVE